MRDHYDDQACITAVASQTEIDFAKFYENLRKILGAGSMNLKNLEDAQTKWLAYREPTCGAIDQLFKDGTARIGMVARCKIQLTRSRMRDLDSIYEHPLHH